MRPTSMNSAMRTLAHRLRSLAVRIDPSFVFLALVVLFVGACLAREHVEQRRDVNRMTEAARALVASLDASQRERGVLPFDGAERRNWHYIPRDRQGLKLAELTPAQTERVHALLASALSARGRAKVDGIVKLEAILGELEGAPGKPNPNRDPGRYCVTLFGAPGAGAWGWRFEGHHVALNFTSIGDELVATTPFFLGTNPAHVLTGPDAGLAVRGREEELARALVTSLDAMQRERATLPGAVPADVILGPGRDAGFEQHLGLPLAALNAGQRATADALLREILGDLADEDARAASTRFAQCGTDALRFAWSGGTKAREPHYWRFDAVTAAIEWDDTQNGANHVHLLWRDLEQDFGDDALKRHHERDHADPRQR
ncbi:MAG: DUF3500 domain-containing protein [Planctomycetes bacterium]|nr:DUF3500 domain-containing protein [Planctomycetota bacterium]